MLNSTSEPRSSESPQASPGHNSPSLDRGSVPRHAGHPGVGGARALCELAEDDCGADEQGESSREGSRSSDRGVAGRSAAAFRAWWVNNLGVILSPIRMTDALQTTAAGSFLYRRRHGFCGRCFLKIRRPGNPFWG
jgi:hypothetical protein